MPLYRKKPIQIEAREVPDPHESPEAHRELWELAVWCGGEVINDAVDGRCILINTLEGQMKALPGAFVINTGDMMQVWSNDRYQAALHRVLASDDVERYSIPFFYNPMAGTTVEPLPSVVSAAQPAHYRPIDWSDFRSKRTDGDYADYGPEVQIAQYRIAS